MASAGAMALGLLLALFVSTGGAASTAVTVTVAVPSEVDLTNNCQAAAATQLGSVLPGSSATSTTGGSVCSLQWHSSNDTSMLRIGQRDGAGSAMGTVGTWTPSAYDNATMITAAAYDANHVMVAGRQGIVRRWINGSGWTEYSLFGGGEWWADIEPVPGDMNTWYAVGSGSVLRMTNAQAAPTFTNLYASLTGGSTWPAGTQVAGVAVVDANTIVIVGQSGWVAKGTNLGTTPTWTAFQLATAPNFADVDWAGGNAFIAVGDKHAMINNATFSAANWSTGANPSGGPQNDLVIAANNQYYSVGNYGSIERCVVANCPNASWTNQSSATLVTDDLTSVTAATATPGTSWAFSNRGQVFQTTNNGATWSRLGGSPTSTAVLGATALATNNLMIAGGDRTTWQTTNGGTTWSLLASSGTGEADMSDVDFSPTNGQLAVAVGDRGKISRTTNGGSSWTTIASGTAVPLLGVSFANASLVWAVGESGTLLRSDDAGLTWTTQSLPTSVRLWSVDSFDENTAWAVGDDGVVVKTTNGGTSWNIVPITTVASLRTVSVDTSTSGHVLVGGCNGAVRVTANGGGTWTSGTTPGSQDLTSSSFGSATVAWGQDEGAGSTMRSTDGGITWSNVTPTGGWPIAIDAVNDRIAYVADRGRRVWRTEDAGVTWTTAAMSSNPALLGVAAVDGNMAYMVGEGGQFVVLSAASGANSLVADYAGAPNNWAGAGGLFGVCLQDVGAGVTVNGAGGWVKDTTGGPQCIASDADPWKAVPASVSKVAEVGVGATGRADFVWGFKAQPAQAAGNYSATVVFEALAPAV